jgi:hemerythrin superfamily protein
MLFGDKKSPVDIIKKDHKEVDMLFKAYETDVAKKDVANKISKELTKHAEMEEKFFYPGVKKISSEADSLISESIKEHNEIKKHIEESEEAEGGELDKHVNMIKESVMHHVQEEESRVLPLAEENMQNDFPDIAQKMMDFKKEMQ